LSHDYPVPDSNVANGCPQFRHNARCVNTRDQGKRELYAWQSLPDPYVKVIDGRRFNPDEDIV
jgi:hypothetical protein